jgi:hypothetical protein
MYGKVSSPLKLDTIFSSQSHDGSIWGMLVEKVWAKLNGNYEFIIGGDSSEGYLLFGGCPSIKYKTTDSSTINNNGS